MCVLNGRNCSAKYRVLIDCNMCVLNGRNCIINDYTPIPSKGCSVVDYCFVQHEKLDWFSGFVVTRATELSTKANLRSGFSPASIPDHSVLSWTMDLVNVSNIQYVHDNLGGTEGCKTFLYDKFDLASIPADWMKSDEIISNIHICIFK
jgi:hypothetical protein